ncbi:RHS repeat-associated core domain-containing protein [Xanthomonas sacchari]|uniref:RHS repeat-associated core domain-containing protein n=1 Tax=Xanthomonas sacchari TaxID=56458 RepID=UPI0029813EBF|nr:RHS repeat-associated core domain-containing protein [Xanthomonas sacchari]
MPDPGRGQTLSYDANGNLLSDGVRTYVWNARDQLVEIKQGTASIASFGYDPLSRRVSKTEGGQTISYLYDGLDAVQETQGGTVNPILTGLGIDERYARVEASGRAYFLTDALGSTRALTSTNGELIQRYDYTPYGQTSQASAGTSNPYQYTGRERDASGLYYYRARYYSPNQGRFVSEDPIGLAGGLNSYAYVNGNPISLTDSTRLACDQRGCWVTPVEQAYANSGNYGLYYQAACTGGDLYACRAREVALNQGLLSGITNTRLGNSILEKSSAKSCKEANADMYEKIEKIRVALARAHANALNSAGASPKNPVMLDRMKDVGKFHDDVFRENGAGAVFGGKTYDSLFGRGGGMIGALRQAVARYCVINEVLI